MPKTKLSTRLLFCLTGLYALLISGCGPFGNRDVPIPTAIIKGNAQKATQLVIVLPGRQDDLQVMKASGIVEAIQRSWPQADVMLVELTLAYYLDGQGSKRLHTQIIEPARAQGYKEIWLSGASMGGMGILLYDRFYPDSADGMILMAPYLGSKKILKEIMQAGGITQWDPGPKQEISRNNWQREMWRNIKTWQTDPVKAKNIWLTYGKEDRLSKAVPVIAPALRETQILEREGGHKWVVWVPAMADVIEKIVAEKNQMAINEDNAR